MSWIRNRGVFVRRLFAEQAANIYDERAVQFAFSGKPMAMKTTDEDIIRLHGFVALTDAAIAKNDRKEHLRW